MLSVGNDRFELRRLIGEGSYGEVYEAFDFETDRRVAVKLMFQSGRAAEARFEREASLLAELDHPNVVRYVAHGQTPSGQAYLAMEWLQGEPLDFRLRRKPMQADEVIALARCVVAGLAFAATKGITHRDIKPGNLYLIARDPANAKILDLGLGRHTLDQQLTRTGALVGTPLYMSPEQARGGRDVDPRSDVFSLGSVLYECLCVDRPFEGAHPMATLAKICMEEPVPLEVNAPQTPPRMAALVHAMLSKDRERRPPYPFLIQELDAVARGVPLQSVQARSLRSRSEQRVLSALFVGAGAELAQIAGARHEHLLDGSQILVFDAHANALDQAVSCARTALSLASSAPIALCTGKARVGDGGALLGELLERGVALLLETPPGSTRVDPDSAALLGARFELSPDNTLLRERTGEAPRTLLGHPTRFVGRDRELGQLTLVFRECAEERVARAVLVSAPPGAGKSRLRYELVESLRAEDLTVLTARGDAMRTGLQLGMLASALRGWRPDSAKLAALLPAERAPIVGAFLDALLGRALGDSRDPQIAAARRDPTLLAERMQESWLEWLRALCERGPVLLCVEDLHWSDPASVRALDQALRNLAQTPLMVLGFARPEVREVFPNLWLERDLTELRLPKLTSRSCERVLESVLPQAEASLRQALIERADGNPFFLEELVRALSAGDTQLPDSVLGVVQARLDHLGDELKQVIRAASVFGALFTADGVRALLGGGPSLDDALRMLIEREVVFTRGADEYVFRHGLIRDAAYLLLEPELRESAHRGAAEWLTQRGAPAAVLGEHWERAAAPQRAAPCYGHASLEALDAASFEQTLRWGEKSLACGAQGELLGDVAACMALACSYLMREDDAARLSQLSLANVPSAHPAWWRAAQVSAVVELRRGRADVVSSMLDRIAPAFPNPPTMPEQIGVISGIAAEAYRLLQPELCERATALVSEQVVHSLQGRARAYVHDALMFRALSRGQRDEALRQVRAALETFRSLGATIGIIHALGLTGYLQFELGAFDDAEWTFLEHRQFAGQHASLSERAYSAFYLGLLHLRRGQLHEAEPLLREALDGNDRAGERSHQPETRAALAELCLLRGQLDEARRLLEEALPFLSEELAPASANVYLAYARLELACGAPELALAQLKRALALTDQHGDRIEAAGRIFALHLDCLLACGRRDEAETARQHANRWLDRQLALTSDPELRAGYARLAENERIRAGVLTR